MIVGKIRLLITALSSDIVTDKGGQDDFTFPQERWVLISEISREYM